MQILEGRILKFFTENDNKNTNFIFETNINGNKILWTIEQKFFGLDASSVLKVTNDISVNWNDTKPVNIIWDEKKYIAKLKITDDVSAPLERYFDDGEFTNNQSNKIQIVKCPSCKRSVEIGNEKEIVCKSCGTHFNLTDEQYTEVLTAVNIKKNNEKLFNDLYKLFDTKKLKFLPYIAYYLLLIQMFLIAAYFTFDKFGGGFGHAIHKFIRHQEFLLYLVLPSTAISIIVLFISRKNAYDNNLDILLSIFSTVKKDKNTIECRNCGAPVKSDKVPDFVVCPYCESENIIFPKSVKRINKKLNINLLDVKILHSKFLRHLNRFILLTIIGSVIFYGLFIIYVMYLKHPNHIHFLVKYAAIPFVMYVLTFMLILKFASLPYNPEYDIIDLLPKNISKDLKTNGDSKLPIFFKISWFLGLAVFSYFFVSQFFIS